MADMQAMFQKLRMKNSAGYLALRPLQRLSERIKESLAGLTTELMSGCRYEVVKKVRIYVILPT